MECLRLIANPAHLLPEKQTATDAPLKPKHNYDVKLREIINEKYKSVYLSDLNFKEIVKLMDDYIDEILTHRAVSECLTTIIDNVIENSDKFDFCLPFD